MASMVVLVVTIILLRTPSSDLTADSCQKA